VTFAGGIAHVVGVTRSALARDGLFDARHVTLLVIGWSLLAPAAGLVAAGAGMARRRAWAYPTALALGAFLLVELVLLGSTLGTPAQALPAYAAALACLALWAVAWRRGGRTGSG
jgi:hypothetical protein